MQFAERERSEAPSGDRRERQPEAARTAAGQLAPAIGNRAFAQLAARRWLRVSGPAGTSVVQRFGSEEHRQLGAEASKDAALDMKLDDGSVLAYGEMVALAGDYFGSLAEMKKLLESVEGQQQIRYARFWSLKIGSEAGIPEEPTKKAVRDRYFTLAAANISHFSAGGTAGTNYEQGHGAALLLAFQAGAECSLARWNEAIQAEAFCNHYLSDMFSAGHVRTPRMEMKEWYKDHFPDTLSQIVAFMASRVTDTLDGWGEPVFFSIGGVGLGPRKWIVRWRVRKMVYELGGAALNTFSLGDIVALAYHNQDNKGLGVISDVDPTGAPVPGGYQWPERAKGDGHLKESKITRDMAVAAMRASLEELNEFQKAGEDASAKVGLVFPPHVMAARMRPYYDAALAAHTPFRAMGYVPSEDLGPNSGNVDNKFNWKWGELDPVLRKSVDETIAGDIAGELRKKAQEIGDSEGVVSVYGMTCHARAAVLEFCDYLAANGTSAIEEAVEMKASGLEAAPPWEPRDAGVDLPGGVPDPPDAGSPDAGTRDAGVPVGVGGG